MDIFNGTFLIITSFFLVLFTDFVIDPLVRSQIGEVYFWIAILVIATNILVTVTVLMRLFCIFFKAKYDRR